MDIVTICNMALAHLCISRQIEDMDEETQESETCSLWYERMRDLVLRDYPWAFAERYATLALIEEEPNSEWGYSYRLPSDCVRARRIVTSGTLRSDESKAKYKVSTDATGKLLFTDESPAELVYTARITDPELFDEDFVDALSLRLAHKIAKPLAASVALAAQANEQYQSAVGQARANSENESEPDDQPEAESIRARES